MTTSHCCADATLMYEAGHPMARERDAQAVGVQVELLSLPQPRYRTV
jgi:hypothetical protein